MSPVVFPIQTERSELLIRIEAFDLANTLEPDDLPKMGASEVCDVSLLRKSDYSGVDRKALRLISKMLFDFMADNPDNIIYFYCDDFNDLPRSGKHMKLSPQEYRSRLFSALFADETRRHGAGMYVDDVLSFDVGGENKFIHLIYGTANADKAKVLKDAFDKLKAKP